MHHQCLTRDLNAWQWTTAATDYYRYADTLQGSLLAYVMTAVNEAPLLTLDGEDDSPLTLPASSAGEAEHEGETILWLHDGDCTLLASAVFSMTRDDEAW